MNNQNKINQFFDNWIKRHGTGKGLYGHNIYYIETKDRDGNTTGEAYGLNIITNRGLSVQFGEFPYGSQFHTIHIGDGVTDSSKIPGPTDTRMFHNIASAVYSDFSTTTDGGRFCIWDAVTETLWFQMYVLRVRYDYVIEGVTDFDINEIGISDDGNYDTPNTLTLHAAVYDAEGNLSSIRKNHNEELYISIYATYAMKPQYVHKRMKLLNNNACFVMDPWAYTCGKAYDGNGRGSMEQFFVAYICYPRNTATSYKSRWYGGTMWCKKSASCGNGSNNFFTMSRFYTGNIAMQQYEAEEDNIYNPAHLKELIEDPTQFVDMCVFLGRASAPLASGLYYGNLMAMIAPVKLPYGEPIEDAMLFTDGYGNNSLTCNFGYAVEGKQSAHGLLPIVDFKPTSVKSYNGITHEWDIVETVENTNNDFTLSSYFLYPWTLVWMHTGISGIGDTGMSIWFNHWTDKPITSLDRNIDMYATDSWWDPSTYIHIDDYTNIPSNIGSKTYFLTFGGTRNDAITNPPIVVTRANETKPGIQFLPSVTTQNLDVYPYEKPSINSMLNPVAAGIPIRRHLVCESMGYVWLSNSIYYPDLGISHPITSSDCNINVNQPLPSMRFTEPSGKRILQVFRSNAAPVRGESVKWVTAKLSKVSVFNIPDDPNDPPEETIINLGLPDTYSQETGSEVILTSTETGFVIFNDRNLMKIHVVNILGDASSNYQPYNYILKDPDTDVDIEARDTYAIKYTNYIVYHDRSYVSDTHWKFNIFDLVNNRIIDSVEIDHGEMTSVMHVLGWKNYLYFVFHKDSATMSVGLYNMNEQNPDAKYQVISTDTDIAKSLIPGGGFLDNTGNAYTKWRTWRRLTENYICGDEHGFFTYKSMRTSDTSSSNEYDMPIYYWDENYPDTPVNINGLNIQYKMLYSYGMLYQNQNGTLSTTTSYNGRFNGVEMNVGSFNNDKQKVLIININGCNWNGVDKNTVLTVYVDLNYIRDNRTAITKTNNKYMMTHFYAYPTLTAAHKNCSGKYCSVMYKGKILQCEYDSSDEAVCDKAAITLMDANRVIPHLVSGTTRTLQCYNNPKQIEGIKDVRLYYINDANKWCPDDLLDEPQNQEPNNG